LAHMGELQFARYRTQVLNRPHSARRPITDKRRGLVVPFAVEVVDGVLERPGCGVVVLRGDVDKPVKEAILADQTWVC
jgi:hypothetical protein